MMLKVSRLSVALALAAVTSVVCVPLSQAGVVINPDEPRVGLYLEDNFQLGLGGVSQIYGYSSQWDQRTYSMCESYTDPVCEADPGYFARMFLDTCTPQSLESCISNVWAIDPNGTRIEGQMLKKVEADANANYKEDSNLGLPASNGVGQIWTFPGVTNSAGSNQFFVGVQQEYWGYKAPGDPLTISTTNSNGFYAGIIPVKQIDGNFGVMHANDVNHGGIGAGADGAQYLPDHTPCTAFDYTYCDIRAEFPSGYRFGMTIKFGQQMVGWFSGRLGSPSVSTSSWNTGEEVSIEGTPIDVPGLNFIVPNAQIPDQARKLIFDGQEHGAGGTLGRIQIVAPLGDPSTMDLMTAFVPAFGNRATNNNTEWAFNSIHSNPTGGPVENCTKGDSALAGLVTTNSLTYSDGPPIYDATMGELNYKVASPHLSADGSVAQGTYDLAIRSDVVRCIYKFTKAPIRASVSIQSDDGQNQVATTVVKEANGWLYLSAKGFTFSNPTISLKLSQDAQTTPSPSPTAAASSAPVPAAAPKNASPASSKIACIKGKVVKYVTGQKPTCPTGYKKK